MQRMKPRTIILTIAVVCALALSAVVLAGCGCSRDKDGDDVKKKSKTPEVATVVGSWHLTEARPYGQDDTQLDIDPEVKAKSTIVIKSDMTATMSFVDGTYLGKLQRLPEVEMEFQDAWNRVTLEEYIFSNADGSVEVKLLFVVTNDGTQPPFIMMPIDMTNYYYVK